MSPLILNTIAIPLGLGLALGFALLSLPQRSWVQTLLFGGTVLLVYTLLEGLPALPPVSGKLLTCAPYPPPV